MKFKNIKLKGLRYRLPIGLCILFISPFLWFVLNFTLGMFFVMTVMFPLFYLIQLGNRAKDEENQEGLLEMIEILYLGVFIMIFQYIIYGEGQGKYNDFIHELLYN